MIEIGPSSICDVIRYIAMLQLMPYDTSQVQKELLLPVTSEAHMLKKFAIAVLSVSLFALSGCESPKGPRYQNVRSFSEGMAPVQASNGRWGYINTNNQWLIQPKFEDAQEFKDGRAAVKLNGKWGFINKRGEWQ